jgi:hypothetical protein
MRIANKLSIGAALFGSVILSFAGVAQADDHWDHDRYRDHDRGYHHEHERAVEHRTIEHRTVERRYVEERPVYVHEQRPVIVERPVMMAAPPVVYQPSGPPSMNLNFNIPLN